MAKGRQELLGFGAGNSNLVGVSGAAICCIPRIESP